MIGYRWAYYIAWTSPCSIENWRTTTKGYNSQKACHSINNRNISYIRVFEVFKIEQTDTVFHKILHIPKMTDYRLRNFLFS